MSLDIIEDAEAAKTSIRLGGGAGPTQISFLWRDGQEDMMAVHWQNLDAKIGRNCRIDTDQKVVSGQCESPG